MASAQQSREIADLITEFSVALHKYTIYPAGHPLVDEAAGSLLARLEAILATRPTLAIGVAPTQLIIGGVATEASSAVARELASKLHRRNVGGLKCTPGIERAELGEALGALAREQGASQPDDAAAVTEQSWPHIRIFPLTYEQLHLDDDRPASDATDDLWLGLARSALDAEDRAESAVLNDPVLVARAIAARKGDAAYDETIIDYLGEFTKASRREGGAEAVAGQRFVAAVVASLDQPTLRRLLELGGDGERRREFVARATEVMGVEAVVQLVTAAGEVSGQALSPALLRMFGKLSEYAARGPAALRTQAEHELRSQVTALLDGWQLPAGSVDTAAEYQALAAGRLRRTPLAEAAAAHPCEPERVLHMSLETGVMSPATDRAADQMVAEGRVGELLGILREAPVESAELDGLRERILSVGTVREVTERRPLDLAVLAILTEAIGPPAASPLLDTLAGEDDRTMRRRLLELLAGLGPSIGPEVVARLEAPEWYVQRNMLALLNALPEAPPGFSPEPFMRHEDVRVRQEAFKLMLRDPALRDAAVCDGLRARDDRTLRMALAAAEERCPPAATALLVQLVTEGPLDASLQPLALRALAQSGSPAALNCLVTACLARRRFFRRQRLAAKSPAMIAALSGLAARWRGSPRAAEVLALA
ncbi:MAG: hypothetical protein H0U85_06050, partial [Gemmatimonadales bacterium]|nr:hypothetical protein [Gemmatimonadales bacterium]